MIVVLLMAITVQLIFMLLGWYGILLLSNLCCHIAFIRPLCNYFPFICVYFMRLLCLLYFMCLLCLFSGLELQAEEMPVHTAWPPGLHQNLFLSQSE